MSGEQRCALALGIVFTVLGIAGFIPALITLPADVASTSTSVPITASDIPGVAGSNYMAAYLRGFGYLFGLFPTNLLHNMLRLAVGLFGIYSATGELGAFNYNRFFAVFYLAIAVLGLFPLTNTLFGTMPIFGNNVWVSAITGAIAAYYAFVWHRSHDDLTTPQV